MNKGRRVWCPPDIIDEMDNILNEEKIPMGHGQKSQALKKMAKYSKVGREAKKILNFVTFQPRRK